MHMPKPLCDLSPAPATLKSYESRGPQAEQPTRSAQHSGRDVDMSPQAIGDRLRSVARLYRLGVALSNARILTDDDPPDQTPGVSKTPGD